MFFFYSLCLRLLVGCSSASSPLAASLVGIEDVSISTNFAVERLRPTASARRQREVVVVAEDAPHVDDAVEEVFQHADEAVDDFEGFPRPRDPLVLIVYADHVAVIVWNEEERPELKLFSHGRKVQKFGIFAVEIERSPRACG